MVRAGWFFIVKSKPILFFSRPKIFNDKLRNLGRKRILCATFAALVNARTAMRLFFVMVVIWQSIKNATVCHIFPRDNGYAVHA